MARRKQSVWLDCFLDFIKYLTIPSKEIDGGGRPVPLLDIMYGAQHRFLQEIASGLDDGIHDFKCLKGRQQGISSISLAVDVFWLSMHDKLQGALITDDDANKEKFRILIEQYIGSLPRGLRVGIKAHNRNNLVLANGSVLDYLVAGTRHGKESLGTSRALNFIHCTEMCNWGPSAGVENLTSSLAEKHPHRLYIWESTAKGYNLWWDIWSAAKRDKLSQKCFFIPWYLKEDYALNPKDKKDRQLLAHYGEEPPDEVEADLIKIALEKYGWTITTEQLAWHRWMRTAKITDEDRMNEQYPWHEDMAFIASGKTFFSVKRIGQDRKFLTEYPPPARAYRYFLGEDFTATRMERLNRIDEDTELLIFEDPVATGRYVVGMDPAFGRNENKNNHCIQIYRAFADRLVQVAEYAACDCDTYQAAWVLAHLCGVYKNVRVNLEITGPGSAIVAEFKHLKQLINAGLLHGNAETNARFEDVLSNVGWFMYSKYDSPGAGFMWHWKSTAESQPILMNQLRDSYMLGHLVIRSKELLFEMERVTQDGDKICASGRANDDRVFATALANRMWMDQIRPGMISSRDTYERVMEKERQEREKPGSTFIGDIIQDFFRVAERERREREFEAEYGPQDESERYET